MTTQPLTRRRFLIGASSATLVAAAGCGGGSSSGSSHTVTFLNEETDPPQLRYLHDALAEYKKKTGVTVQLTQSSIGGKFQKLVQSVKAGESYDLSTSDLHVYSYTVKHGWLEQLDSLVKAVGGPNAFMPHAMYSHNGHYYMFPYALNNTLTYFRTDWLDDVNEDVPQTWDDLKRALKKLTQAGKPGIAQPLSLQDATGDVGSEFLWSNRVEFFDQNWNVILDQEPNLTRCSQSLEFLKELKPYIIDGMLSADFGTIVKAFAGGTASVASYAGRVVDTIERNAPELHGKFTGKGYPTPERGMEPSNALSVNAWLIPDQADAAPAAVDFLEWFIKHKYVGFLLAVPFNTQPPLKSVYNDKKWRSDPKIEKYPDIVRTQEAMAAEDGFRTSGIAQLAPGLGIIKQKIASAHVLGEMYQKVTIKGTPPKTATKEAADKIRQLAGSTG